jgi:hypothetical protein
MGSAMRRRLHDTACGALGLVAAMLLAEPVRGQAVMISGRIEDAYTREPIVGARVLAPDSSAVFSDSLGVFGIAMDPSRGLFLSVTQFGYVAQRFDLPPEAPGRRSVLLLEPLPLELEAINVVSESAVDRVFRQLRARRNSYQGSVMAFDRARIERFSQVGSAWDFVVMRASGIHECDFFGRSAEGSFSSRSGVCVRGRSSINDPYPEIPVLVCVDGFASFGAMSELETIDIRNVALIEIYSRGRGGVRIYTAPYLASTAGRGRNIATPLGFGC